MGGGGVQAVFLRKGKTSNDTLGYGLTGTASTGFPSATVNASVPDVNGVPQPWKAGVASIETGVALPGFGATYTTTPEQIGHFVGGLRYVQPAMEPDDELSAFARTLQSGAGTVGTPDDGDQAIRYIGSRYQEPLGDGMGGWRSSARINPQPAPTPSQQPDRPGGLLGLLIDQLQTDEDRFVRPWARLLANVTDTRKL